MASQNLLILISSGYDLALDEFGLAVDTVESPFLVAMETISQSISESLLEDSKGASHLHVHNGRLIDPVQSQS